MSTQRDHAAQGHRRVAARDRGAPPPAEADSSRGPAGQDSHEGQDGYDEFFAFDDGDYVRIPRRTSFARRLATVAAIGGLLVALVLGGGAYALARVRDPAGPPGPPIELEIPRNSSMAEIARLLDEAGVIENAQIFRYYAARRHEGGFQAGTYQIGTNLSFDQAIAALAKGPALPPFVQVTVPEGLTLNQLARRLGDAVERFSPESVLAAAADPSIRSRFQPPEVASLEGVLFPDTYRIEDRDSEVAALGRMTAQFDKVAGELGYDQAPERVNRWPWEVLVIASMIEREAKVPEDRAKVARVIYNRLDAGMTLGIDATTQYAVYLATGQLKASLTRSDLEIDSPYNTRRYPGLPPGPIASPGRATLEAALNPAEGDWLYYVLADPAGHHFFTKSAREFERQKKASQDAGLIP
ncbi:MAG: endolytic transglycosylase MltG [Acidimicrobiales bacterium]